MWTSTVSSSLRCSHRKVNPSEVCRYIGAVWRSQHHRNPGHPQEAVGGIAEPPVGGSDMSPPTSGKAWSISVQPFRAETRPAPGPRCARMRRVAPSGGGDLRDRKEHAPVFLAPGLAPEVPFLGCRISTAGPGALTLPPRREKLAADDFEHRSVYANLAPWTNDQGHQLADSHIAFDGVVSDVHGDGVSGCYVEVACFGATSSPGAQRGVIEIVGVHGVVDKSEVEPSRRFRCYDAPRGLERERREVTADVEVVLSTCAVEPRVLLVQHVCRGSRRRPHDRNHQKYRIHRARMRSSSGGFRGHPRVTRGSCYIRHTPLRRGLGRLSSRVGGPLTDSLLSTQAEPSTT